MPGKSFNVTHLNHVKNQISTSSDPFPSLDDLFKKNWCGRPMAKIFTFIPLYHLLEKAMATHSSTLA